MGSFSASPPGPRRQAVNSQGDGHVPPPASHEGAPGRVHTCLPSLVCVQMHEVVQVHCLPKVVVSVLCAHQEFIFHGLALPCGDGKPVATALCSGRAHVQVASFPGLPSWPSLLRCVALRAPVCRVPGPTLQKRSRHNTRSCFVLKGRQSESAQTWVSPSLCSTKGSPWEFLNLWPWTEQIRPAPSDRLRTTSIPVGNTLARGVSRADCRISLQEKIT